MRISYAQNVAESDFWENFFFRPKMPEICRKSPFLQIFIRLFLNISLFFHTKTLLKTMPTIKHGSTVNKTYFWSRNCLKIAGTADFRRKNGISWISRAVLYIFSWNFAHWCEMAIPKMWRSQIFENIFFRLKMPKNRFFLEIGLRHILGIAILHLCAKNQQKLMDNLEKS